MQINQVWDRISKCLICIVDAYLNWFFLKNVKVRLVQDAGLMKYQPLVDFNTRLMIVSVLMDVSNYFDLHAEWCAALRLLLSLQLESGTPHPNFGR